MLQRGNLFANGPTSYKVAIWCHSITITIPDIFIDITYNVSNYPYINTDPDYIFLWV